MAAVNSVQTSRLPLPSFSPRAVLMYSAAVGGEGAVALQLREATPGDLDAARFHEDRLAIACQEPELLADLLQAAAEIGGEGDGLSALFGVSSPDLAGASDASDSLPLPDHDNDIVTTTSRSMVSTGVTAAVSVAVSGIDPRPHITKKVRPKPSSPNRQGPQQCQTCNKIFGNASALAKHKLTHSDERKYVCTMCSKAFKRQDHLNGHMLTHRNKKPYECKASGCGKSYCDARSLRRHTENHHQPSSSDGSDSKLGGISLHLDSSIQSRGVSPASPMVKSIHSEANNSSEKSIISVVKSKALSVVSSGTSSGSTSGNSSSSDSSPPATPPAPLTPPSRSKPHRVSTTKTKSFTISIPSAGLKCSGGNTSNNAAATTTTGPCRPAEGKPVECNLCHRKFKNIPALNGHMRLHGGYFKKDSDSKKSDKKETSGPPLQTASVSVRALIEEKIISRRGATATTTTQMSTETTTSRSSFVVPAPLPISSSRISTSPASPMAAIAATSTQFVSPRAPPVVTVTSVSNTAFTTRDSTLIELLKKGNTKVVKRSSSDPGQFSPQPEIFRPELFGVSFHSDDGYFSPALNDDSAFQFSTNPENLEELASLEDYATVAASIRDRSPITYPSNRRLAAVLNSPLPESLADFGACHGGSPVHSPSMGYAANSPGLSYTTGDSPGLSYTDASPGGGYSAQTAPSPGLGYPTPPGSHDAQSPATIPRASSPLTAAFFTATMSSQEEVEEALEEVLPEECGSLDAFSLDPSPSSRRIIMLNSEDPLLSSSPRDFSHQKPFRRMRGNASSEPSTSQVHQWHIPTENNALQVCVEGKDMSAVFLSPNSIPPSPQRRKRKGSPAGPHRTRMRRPMNQYTPQPILPPDRDGPGLFIDISAYQVPEQDSEMEDPPPRINIGVDHQAEIPEPCGDRDDMHRVPEQLLWDPGINDSLDEKEVRMFTELAMCAAMPVGGHSREHALRILGESGGDVRVATLKLMEYSPEGDNERWTPDEVETYLSSLRHYDKDFYRMAQLIRTKTSKQCIQFYYFWKKLTKDYKTLYLRSWSAEPAPHQGAVVQEIVQGQSPGTSSPSPFEGEEFPCKICGKVFNKVKSRSAHMKSHRPLDAEPKRPKVEKPYEKV